MCHLEVCNPSSVVAEVSLGPTYGHTDLGGGVHR